MNVFSKFRNWKGTGKDRDPILDKRKGNERFPIFCLEDRKGPHSRKNGQVNMYEFMASKNRRRCLSRYIIPKGAKHTLVQTSE